MGQIFHGLALNTTVWSYAGQFNLCILSDHKLLPNGWELIDHYCEAFAEYAELLEDSEDREAIAARFRGHKHSLLETSPA